MLEKREKYLQTKIDSELKYAKANASKNKRGEFFSLNSFFLELVWWGLDVHIRSMEIGMVSCEEVYDFPRMWMSKLSSGSVVSII